MFTSMAPAKPTLDSPLLLHCLHVLATLPEDYDLGLYPGYIDSTDGASMSCGISFSAISKRKLMSEDSVQEAKKKKKDMKIDVYFSKKPAQAPSTSKDELDSANVSSTTPWKLAVLHKGTKNTHWHFIYISSHGCFKSSSKLGDDIFNTRNKVQKVRCIQCLYNYLHSGNGRKVVLNNMTDRYKYLIVCEKHLGLVEDEVFYGQEEEYEEENLLRSLLLNQKKSATKGILYNNDELIDMFLSDRAFTESTARICLTKTYQGRNFLFKNRSNDTIRTAIQTSKILVFQESPMKRLRRAKMFYEKHNNNINVLEQLNKLQIWLKNNNINEKQFSQVTFRHFMKQTGKKNNLFFKGPPSTGKSMIMESLLCCNFNVTRITGIIESSPFNFASLVYCNACFMDEIKISDNQFEQWKLLAGGQPCTTDVKYQEKCDITNCLMYTASNYEIDLFCTVPGAKRAIEERTFIFEINYPCEDFFTMAPHTWEYFWKLHNTE